VTLTFASWRSDDAAGWNDKIIPAFEKSHPGIQVKFTPTEPTQYDASVATTLAGGTAADIIACRSYSPNRELIKKGYLEPLTGLKNLKNFTSTALDPWSGTDGTRYCAPGASTSPAFYYNKTIFKELGLKVPKTEDELLSVLAAIKKDGKYDPIAFSGSPKDNWVLSDVIVDGFGPNYWDGENGNQGLIKGTTKMTDPGFVAALTAIDAWKPYFPSGVQSITNADAQQLFASGKAALYPAGSWDITTVEQGGADIGVFAPPLPKSGDQLWVQQQPDLGIGINHASKHVKEAKEFVDWVMGDEYQSVMPNALPGLFGMSSTAKVKLADPLAQAFADMRADSKSTPRIGQDELAGPNPGFESTFQDLLAKMLMSNDATPEQTAQGMQTWLESWYKPQQ
jgi:raffinose/stachyose/melibiose transport system substrate-binding protein